MLPLKVCHPVLNSLAVSLPYAHCSQVKKSCHQGKNFILTFPSPQSRLICSISGRALDENNQPMMLPNGNPLASTCWSLPYLKRIFKDSHCVEELFISKSPGYVYGEQALTSQAGQNEGKVICPR